MERNRPGVVGPLILITIGVLFLLANQGMLPFSFWDLALRFWPLILVLFGLEIIIGRRSALGALVVVVLWIALVGGALWIAYAQGNALLPNVAAVTDQVSQPLGDLKSATVDLNIGTARTTVGALGSDTSDLMQGTFRHAEGTRVTKTYDVVGTEGRLGLKEEGVNFILFQSNVSQWDVKLYPQIPLALSVNGGIGTATLDLSALNVTSLSVDSGVGSINMTTPKAGTTTMQLNGGVGSANVTIPPGVAARLRVNAGLGGVHIDTARFPKLGDTYQSADFASATNKIDIEVDGGLGSINVR